MQAEFDSGAAAFAVIAFVLANGYHLPEVVHLATLSPVGYRVSKHSKA